MQSMLTVSPMFAIISDADSLPGLRHAELDSSNRDYLVSEISRKAYNTSSPCIHIGHNPYSHQWKVMPQSVQVHFTQYYP